MVLIIARFPAVLNTCTIARSIEIEVVSIRKSSTENEILVLIPIKTCAGIAYNSKSRPTFL